MIIKSSEFIKSAYHKKDYPSHDFMEIAMVGRSNVGKSSFINKMCNRKSLARVSKEQGKTVSINFYEVNHQFCLVDLPGYGYAKVSQAERASWGKMMETYLGQRENLGAVILLLDIRHKPTKDDMVMFEYILSNGYDPFVVLTKADKLKKYQIEESVARVKELLALKEVFVFSSKDGTGRDEILDKIEGLLP
jgi:ribosome biogenesis GTP-binding protein ysxC